MPDLPAGFRIVERTNAASQGVPEGFRVVEKPEAEKQRGMLSPVFKRDDGGGFYGYDVAMPQIALDIGKAMQAPGKALRGDYAPVISEEGRVDPYSPMIPDAMGLAATAPMSGAGSIVSRIPRSISGRREGAFNAAQKVVAEQLGKDQVPLDQLGPRLKAIGPDAIIGDLGPGTQGLTQGLATHPGTGQKTVVDALLARQKGSNSRIQAEINDIVGPTPTPSFIKADIRASQKALSPEYQAVLKDAKSVDATELAHSLEALEVNLRGKAQQAAKQVRDMLNIKGGGELDPHPGTLLQTRHAIDGMLDGETNGNVINVLTDARKQVDDLLTQSVPGIKQVDAKFAELARQSEGVTEGAKLLDTGKTALRPEELALAAKEGAIPQGLLVGPSGKTFRMTQGARAEIDRIIGTNLNDKIAIRNLLKGEGSWNRDRLVSLFGEDKAKGLLRVVEREAKFAETAGPALGGSRTQVIRAANEALNGPRLDPGILENVGNLKAGTAVSKALQKVFGGVSEKSLQRRNAMIADIVTSGAENDLTRSMVTRPGANAGELGANLAARALIERRSRQASP